MGLTQVMIVETLMRVINMVVRRHKSARCDHISSQNEKKTQRRLCFVVLHFDSAGVQSMMAKARCSPPVASPRVRIFNMTNKASEIIWKWGDGGGGAESQEAPSEGNPPEKLFAQIHL